MKRSFAAENKGICALWKNGKKLQGGVRQAEKNIFTRGLSSAGIYAVNLKPESIMSMKWSDLLCCIFAGLIVGVLMLRTLRSFEQAQSFLRLKSVQSECAKQDSLSAASPALRERQMRQHITQRKLQ